MEKIIIAAFTEKRRVIGSNGKIPWDYPEDLKHFRKVTMNHPVLMGRRTFNSLPESYKPLEGRENIVLSNSFDYIHDNVFIVSSLNEAWEKANKFDDKVFIAGGESVYQQTLDQADKMYLTIIKKEFEGDSFFPEYEASNWEEVKKDDRKEICFKKLVRK